MHAARDAGRLVWFRVFFGLLMMVEVMRYAGSGWIRRYYITPEFHFKYYGFSWVEAWPGYGMYVHFAMLGVAAFCIAVGWMYRVAATIFFLGFTYVFLLDQGRYLNHHYLICLLAFLMIFVPAHRAFSIDAWRRPSLRRGTAPAWAVGLLQFQMCVVYTMAAIAKMNMDWLQGEPVRMWLLKRVSYPVLGPYLAEPWTPYFIAYAGLAFDLLVVPLLLWRRTRYLAMLMALMFNFINHLLFDIGIFPWITLAATVVLFRPSLPLPWRRIWHQGERDEEVCAGREARGRWLSTTLIVTYIAIQILVPWRHWLYPGDVAWTEEGHRFSWRMMLRSKEGALTLHARDRTTGETWTVEPLDYVNENQFGKCATRPDMLLQLCHHVAERLAAEGRPDVEIKVTAMVSLNGRVFMPLVAPEADLAHEPRVLTHAWWITPFSGVPLSDRRKASDQPGGTE